MSNVTTIQEGSVIHWPFPPKDSFAEIPAKHHLSIINSLPGILFWPGLMFGFMLAGGFLTVFIWSSMGGGDGAYPIATVFMVTVTGAYVVFGAIFWKWLSRQDLSGRVFSLLPKNINEIGIGAIAFLIALFVGGPLALMFHEYAMSDPALTLAGGVNPDEITNVDDFLSIGAPPWALFMLAVIAAPIIEEALFRGWMLPMMISRGMPVLFAILISSLFFGLIHIADGLQVMTYTFLFGICLGTARIVSGRLAAPVMAHVFNNAWALFVIPKLISLPAG